MNRPLVHDWATLPGRDKLAVLMTTSDSKEKGKILSSVPAVVPAQAPTEAASNEPHLDESAIAAHMRALRVSRATSILVLALVAAACAYLLTPGLFSQRIPYGEESVGKFSDTVIKATRDYNIPDLETTKRLQDEAREAAPLVYDYDVRVAESALERVASAFEMMRAIMHPGDNRPRNQNSAEQRPDESRKHATHKDKAEVVSEASLREIGQHREEWERRLETHLDEESFRAFAEAHFSEQVEHEIERLLLRVKGLMVAEYHDPVALSGGRGIVVRQRNGTESTETDVSKIRDQEEIRKESERWITELSSEFSPVLRKAVVTLAVREIRSNLWLNREETEERKRIAVDSVKPAVIPLRKGEKIIGDGERIERHHLVIFAAIKRQANVEDSLLVRLGGGLLAALLVAVVYGFARASLQRFRPTRKDALLGAITLVGFLGMVNLWITVCDALHDRFSQFASETLYYAAPVAAGAMLIRFVLTSEAAVVYAIVIAGLCAVLAGNSLAFGLFTLIGSLVAASHVARAKDRATLFRAGLYTGLANVCTVICFALLSNKIASWKTAIECVGGFFGGAFVVPMLVMGITPLVEAAFGYTTDIKLLELANLNHPALKELIVQAPGTYHHSIIIGSLVEAAAEAIGANPLLARVCAYYHDIGKGKNPLYYGENQRGENRHEKLAPQMSALIIKRHVLDGVEMARHYKLPNRVADAIAQHHGTRLVGYFYHKALKEQENKTDVQLVDEGLYRYSGPKPQNRETALVMIADAVEAASRAVPDPTPPKLQALVQKIINGIFADGQLDECDLTLRDLNEIARAFYRTLGGIYHSRPDYSAQALQGPRLAEVRDSKPDSKRVV